MYYAAFSYRILCTVHLPHHPLLRKFCALVNHITKVRNYSSHWLINHLKSSGFFTYHQT